MLTLQTILLALMMGIPTPQAVLRGLLAPPASAPVTNTYTMVQHKLTVACPASTTCTATFPAAAGAGHLIEVLASNFQTSEVAVSSITDNAGSSYIVVPTACTAYGSSSGFTGGGYTLNSASGATTVTVTWAAVVQAGSMDIIEASSTSAPQFDQCNATTVAGDATPPTIPITPATSSEYIFQEVAPDSSCTAIAAPYTTPAEFATGGTADGFAGAINQSSGASVNWTCTGSTSVSQTVMAFK